MGNKNMSNFGSKNISAVSNKNTSTMGSKTISNIGSKSVTNVASKNTINLGSKTGSTVTNKTASFMNFSSGNSPKISSANTSPPISGGKTNTTFFSSKELTGVTSKYDPLAFTQRTKKPSTSLGIIWIPTKKRTKKDIVHCGYTPKEADRTPSMYNYMSGDSELHATKKKDEEANLLVPERSKAQLATVASGSAGVAIAEGTSNNVALNPEEKQSIKQEEEEDKEAAGDAKEKSNNTDYLENNDPIIKTPDKIQKEKEKAADKVDSVYLRRPPAHKTRSNRQVEEEDSCGMKCLYYTVQCCDCVLQ